ncbi:hypothetical protein D3C87_1429050 [compost metagenome]
MVCLHRLAQGGHATDARAYEDTTIGLLRVVQIGLRHGFASRVLRHQRDPVHHADLRRMHAGSDVRTHVAHALRNAAVVVHIHAALARDQCVESLPRRTAYRGDHAYCGDDNAFAFHGDPFPHQPLRRAAASATRAATLPSAAPAATRSTTSCM